jgi:hypothetical protein
MCADDRQGALCSLLESKLSTTATPRIAGTKRPRLETVAKEQGLHVLLNRVPDLHGLVRLQQ